MKKVAAIVVTYNRKELLRGCIESILNQDYKVDCILLVNNASTDGTLDYLKGCNILDKVELIDLKENTGGAGGFYEGMKTALSKDIDYIWMMDDDVVTKKNSLKILMDKFEKMDEKASFLISTIYGQDGKETNIPNYVYHNHKKVEKNGMLQVRDGTFVSILFPKEVVEKCGLPCKDYFIWGDDTEYTMRVINNYGNAYQVLDSKVLHERTINKGLNVFYEENEERIKMYEHFFENIYINKKLYNSWWDRTKFYLAGIRTAIISLPTKYGKLKYEIVMKGLHNGKKNINRVREYIDSQLK